MGHKEDDLERIHELIEVMKNNDLVEVEIKHGDDKILLKRAQPQLPVITSVPMASQNLSAAPTDPNAAQTPPQQAPVLEEEMLEEIKSPIVGTFYTKPTPDSEPYVEVGSKVTPQTVVAIIEAMKVMNEIKAETSGTIVAVLVESGQAVEYGQSLLKIRPE